jgi:hypothetical protein
MASNAAPNLPPAPVAVNVTVPPAAIANSGRLLANAVKSANEISKGLNSVASKLSTAADALKKNESKIATAVVNATAAAAAVVNNAGPPAPQSPGAPSPASEPVSPGGNGPAGNGAAGNGAAGNGKKGPAGNGNKGPAGNGNLENVNLSGPLAGQAPTGLGVDSVIGGRRSTLMSGTRKAIRSIARMIGGLRQTAVNAAKTVDVGVKAVNSMANTLKKNVTLANVKAANTMVANALPAVAKNTNSVLKANVVPPVKVNANNGAAQVKAVNKAATQVMNATKSNYNTLSGGRRKTRRHH